MLRVWNTQAIATMMWCWCLELKISASLHLAQTLGTIQSFVSAVHFLPIGIHVQISVHLHIVQTLLFKVSYFQLSSPQLNLTWFGSDRVVGQTTTTHTTPNKDHFQATWEADIGLSGLRVLHGTNCPLLMVFCLFFFFLWLLFSQNRLS